MEFQFYTEGTTKVTEKKKKKPRHNHLGDKLWLRADMLFLRYGYHIALRICALTYGESIIQWGVFKCNHLNLKVIVPNTLLQALEHSISAILGLLLYWWNLSSTILLRKSTNILWDPWAKWNGPRRELADKGQEFLSLYHCYQQHT